MKRGSFIAGEIDMEYQRKKRATLEREFMKKYCNVCSNKSTYKCNIVQTISGRYKCVEFKEKEKNCDN